MPKYLFNMTEDMAAAVEAYRVRWGMKTTLQALRELLARGIEDSAKGGRSVRVVSDTATIKDRNKLVTQPADGRTWRERSDDAALLSALQFGPTKRKPGDGLKKPKGNAS